MTTSTHAGCGCQPDYGKVSVADRSSAGSARYGALAGLASHGAVDPRWRSPPTPYTGDVLGGAVAARRLRRSEHVRSDLGIRGTPRCGPTSAFPQSALLPLDAMFGMHPAMQPLMPLWETGTFGVVQAVGMATRRGRTSRRWRRWSVRPRVRRCAPAGSTGPSGCAMPARRSRRCRWAAACRRRHSCGPSPELAMWSVDDFELSGAWDATERQRWATALDGLHDGAPATVGAPASTTTVGRWPGQRRCKMRATSPDPAANYPDADLGRALRDVARVIKAGVGLQVAAVDYGDWDMHTDLGTVDSGWLTDKLD